jgi:hypothetical protein
MVMLRVLKDQRVSLGYQTRMLKAGDEFNSEELDDPRVVEVMTNPQIGLAEYAEEMTIANRRRLRMRPRRRLSESTKYELLQAKTVPELRDVAEEKGIDLPASHVKHDDLVDIIQEEGSSTEERHQEY